MTDHKLIEFLVKLQDSAQMIADATNEYLESLAPQDAKEENKVAEAVFDLKFEPQHGTKLGNFEAAYKENNEEAKWKAAFEVLSKAKATIKDRYYGKDYAFTYWLYNEVATKIYRQRLKQPGAS